MQIEYTRGEVVIQIVGGENIKDSEKGQGTRAGHVGSGYDGLAHVPVSELLDGVVHV